MASVSSIEIGFSKLDMPLDCLRDGAVSQGGTGRDKIERGLEAQKLRNYAGFLVIVVHIVKYGFHFYANWA